MKFSSRNQLIRREKKFLRAEDDKVKEDDTQEEPKGAEEKPFNPDLYCDVCKVCKFSFLIYILELCI